MTICHNLSVDRAQKADRKTLSIDETLHDNEAGNAYLPDQQLISRDRRQTMMKILATLPEKQRTAIQLRDMEGMEYKEIAKIMDITESDVKVTLFRGRNKLKEEYLKISQYGL